MANYINNADFFTAMQDRVAYVKECRDKQVEPKVIPDYIASCLYEICTRLSYKSNFIGYSYREEMVGDAIENCLRVVDNFNPEKSSNPFAYFTQIAYYAFLRRIATEKRQSYIKGRILSDLPLDELVDLEDYDGTPLNFVETLRQNYHYDTIEYETKAAVKKIVPVGALDAFMGEEGDE